MNFIPPTRRQDFFKPPTRRQDFFTPPTLRQDFFIPPTRRQDFFIPPTRRQDFFIPLALPTERAGRDFMHPLDILHTYPFRLSDAMRHDQTIYPYPSLEES